MAEAFAVLWSRRSSTMEAWRSLQDAAELTRDEERESCVRIQKLWRGQRVRAWVTVMRLACVEIERVFRGHLGRLRHGALATARADREELLTPPVLPTLPEEAIVDAALKEEAEDASPVPAKAPPSASASAHEWSPSWK